MSIIAGTEQMIHRRAVFAVVGNSHDHDKKKSYSLVINSYFKAPPTVKLLRHRL